MTEYSKKYQQSPRGKFIVQRASAYRRGIPWEFTFEQWQKKWDDSGQWENRGNHVGAHYMCRIGDTGSYSPENTYIGTTSVNAQEAWKKRKIKEKFKKLDRNPFKAVEREHLPPSEAAWYVPGWQWTENFDLIPETA